MEIKPIWYDYATFNEDGFVDGVRDDAPEDVKEAYQEYLKEKERELNSGKLMPKY